MSNKNLHAAKRAKNDEFYTRMEDIEAELSHYTEYFKGKRVYLPCDVPESNFYVYFKENFIALGLRSLIATGMYRCGKGIKVEYDGAEETVTREWNGDFRANTEILEQNDIVVTNSPFSLFREFFRWLVNGAKEFLIIGNMSAVLYKDVFPLIKEGKVRIGYKRMNEGMAFTNTDKKTLACWFTTLPVYKEKVITLTKRYTPEEYPKYDNYDAIEVSRVKDIPYNYENVMGVPITFLNGYVFGYEIVDINPHFFTIVEQGLPKPKQLSLKSYGLKDPYARLLIKKKIEIVGLMSGAKGENLVNGNDGRVKFYVNDKGVYARILIRLISEKQGKKVD